MIKINTKIVSYFVAFVVAVTGIGYYVNANTTISQKNGVYLSEQFLDKYMSKFLGVTPSQEELQGLGGAVSPDHYNTQYFFKNTVTGYESVATSSTASTYTLTTREMDVDVPYVSWTPNVNTTLTSMASTSAPFSGLRPGQSFTQTWYNASTTAASTITFAAGTGIDLQELEGGSVIVNGLEGATITYVKKADTDVIMLVAPWQVGD
jgi:hypothetical protein